MTIRERIDALANQQYVDYWEQFSLELCWLSKVELDDALFALDKLKNASESSPDLAEATLAMLRTAKAPTSHIQDAMAAALERHDLNLGHLSGFESHLKSLESDMFRKYLCNRVRISKLIFQLPWHPVVVAFIIKLKLNCK